MVLPGKSLQFTAKITLGGKEFGSQEIEWSISSAHDDSTTINESGLLTVAASETNAELTIKAASKTEPTLFAEKTIKCGFETWSLMESSGMCWLKKMENR